MWHPEVCMSHTALSNDPMHLQAIHPSWANEDVAHHAGLASQVLGHGVVRALQHGCIAGHIDGGCRGAFNVDAGVIDGWAHVEPLA